MYLGDCPSGGKWWRFKYRFGGKEKRLSLGVYPDVALAMHGSVVTRRASCWPKELTLGEQRKADEARAAGRAANSFEAVAREWYAKQAHIWVPTPRIRRAASLGIESLFPRIGDKSDCRISPPQLCWRRCARSRDRGAHDLAHRVLQVAAGVPLRHRHGPLRARSSARSARGADTAQGQASSRRHARGIAGAAARNRRLRRTRRQANRLRASTAGVDVRSHRRVDRRRVERNRHGRRDVDHPGRADEDENRARRAAVAAGVGRFCARCAHSAAEAATCSPAATRTSPSATTRCCSPSTGLATRAR